MERQSEFSRDAMRLDNEQELHRALSALHLSRCERDVLLLLSTRQRAAGALAELVVRRDELVAATGCHSSTVSTACSRLQARGLMRAYRRGRGANSFVVDWSAVFDRQARPLSSGRCVDAPAPHIARRLDPRQLRFEFVNDIACEVVGEAWWGVCVEVGCRVDEFDVAPAGNIEARQQAWAADENATSKRDIEQQRTTSCPENATSNDVGATLSPPSPEVATTASIPSSIPFIPSLPTTEKSIPIPPHGGDGFQRFWEGDGLTTEQLKDPRQVQALYERACEARAAEGLDGRRVDFFALAAMCVRPGVAKKSPVGLFVHRLKGRDGFGHPWWAAAADIDRREAKRMIERLDHGGAVVAPVDGCGTIPRASAPPVVARPTAPPAEARPTRAVTEVIDDDIEQRRAMYTERLRRNLQRVV